MSDRNASAWIIREGQDVLGSDARKFGDVESSEGTYIVVKRGFFIFAKRYYIPFASINSVDERFVHLSVSKADAPKSGWEAIPTMSAAVPVSSVTGSKDGIEETPNMRDGHGLSTDEDRIGGISNHTSAIPALDSETFPDREEGQLNGLKGRIEGAATPDLQAGDRTALSVDSFAVDLPDVGIKAYETDTPDDNLKTPELDVDALESGSVTDGLTDRVAEIVDGPKSGVDAPKANTSDIDATIAGNAATGKLAGAEGLVQSATRANAAIAGNAASGKLADASKHVKALERNEGALNDDPKSLVDHNVSSSDEKDSQSRIAKNAATGTLSGAGDIVANSSIQDDTIAGNALSGRLTGAREHVTKWTSEEKTQTATAASSQHDKTPVHLEGARPIGNTVNSIDPFDSKQKTTPSRTDTSKPGTEGETGTD